MAVVFEKIQFFYLAAVSSVVTFLVQKSGGAVISVESLSLGARVGNALISCCRYLWKMFWPANLAFFYPHPGYWPPGLVLLAYGLIVGLTVLFWVRRRSHPFFLMGWLWYCGTLVPVIGLVQVGGQAMADRYTYIPSVGVLILIVWGAYKLARPWRHQTVILSVLSIMSIIICLVLTRRQIGYWRDSETLYRHAVKVTENNHIAHYLLGLTLFEQGRTDAAISQFEECLRLKPNYANVRYNLGIAFARKGQTDKAINQLKVALELKPNDIDTLNRLGSLWIGRGENVDQARALIEKAVQLEPRNATLLDNLAMVLLKLNQPKVGLLYSLKAVTYSRQPDPALYDHLGDIYATLPQRDQAAKAWHKSITLEASRQVQRKIDGLGDH